MSRSKQSRAAHTAFDCEKVQAAINRLWTMRPPDGGPAPVVEDAGQFRDRVPPMSPARYDDLAWQVYRERRDAPFHVGGSSGTTSKRKLVLTRAPGQHSPPTDEQRALIRELREWFGPGDVAANCFLVGHFSLLHHGFNRILDACGVTTVPLGVFDQAHAAAQLTFLRRAGVNTLVGTPGTLVQIAHAVRDSGIGLDVRNIAFTGEGLGSTKKAFLQSVFPAAGVLALYGTSECGFIAIGEEGNEGYRVREDSFFLETDADGRLLVTTLDPGLPVPLLRYAPGDRVGLSVGPGGGARIGLIERCNQEFNFMGNLIDVGLIRRVVAEGLGLPDPVIDVTLRTSADGRDLLTVRVFGAGESSPAFAGVARLIRSLPELREAMEKNAGDVTIAAAPLEAALLSPRQKHVQIIDERA